MDWVEMVKRYWDLGCYKINDMRVFVEAKKITKEEFQEMTGEDYDKPVESPIKNKQV